MSKQHPGLYKRGSIWWYKFTLNGEKQRESTGLTNEDYAWAATEKYRKMVKGASSSGAADWQVFKEEYFTLGCAGNKPNYLFNKKWTVQEFERVVPIRYTSELIPSLGQRAVDTWLKVRAEQLSARKVKSWSLNTIDTHVTHLKLMAKYAMQKGYTAFADWSVIKKVSKVTCRQDYYTPVRALEIIQAARKNLVDYKFLTILYWLNLRRGEACHARLSWLNRTKHTMTIQPDGAWTPKAESDGRFREVPVPDQIWALLMEWEKSSPSDYIVADENGWRPADEHSWSGRMRDLTTRLKLKEPIYCHKFRHSIITQMNEDGVNPAHIQQAARHRHYATTQRYTHPTTEPARIALQGFADRHWHTKRKRPSQKGTI